MPKRLHRSRFCLVAALFYVLLLSACGGSYEDTIAGVALPVPKGMTKGSEAPVEMKFFGFGAGQASYHGNMEPDKIVEFYKKELPARGWQQSTSVRSGGAMLTYGKEGKSVLIAIGKQNNETTLSLTVGGTGR